MDRINRQQPERQHQRRTSINSLSTITTSSSSVADRSDRSARDDGIFNKPSHAKTSFIPSPTSSSSTDEKYVAPSNGILPISIASDGNDTNAVVNNGSNIFNNVEHEEDDDLYGSFSSIQEHLDMILKNTMILKI